MMIRAFIFAVASWLALAGALAQAKASPSLEMQREFEQRVQENQIRDSSDHGYCDAGTTTTVEQKIEWISRMSRADDSDQTCSKPVPVRDLFEHVAHK